MVTYLSRQILPHAGLKALAMTSLHWREVRIDVEFITLSVVSEPAFKPRLQLNVEVLKLSYPQVRCAGQME